MRKKENRAEKIEGIGKKEGIKKEDIRVLMVNPPRYKGLQVIREERCEIIEGSSVLTPYSLLQAAALVREITSNIKVIDANALDLSFAELEKRMSDIDYNVFFFKFTPTSFEEDINVAKISKRLRPEAKVVGLCYSLGHLSREVMEEAADMDIYIRHEYEVVTSELIKNLNSLEKVDGITYRKSGKIILNKDATPIDNYDSLPIAAFDLLPSLEPYYISVNHGKPFSVVYTSKGCPFNCMFCNVSKSKLKLKSVDRIMEEIDYLKRNYNIKTISFFDETFTIDKKRVEEFCRRIKDYKIKWYCNTRTNLVDPQILKMMREAGCRAISFGIESGSNRILENISKGITAEQSANAIKWAYEAGIKMHCSFIFGLPGEDKESIEETYRFVRKTLPMSAEFNIATPYPGTRLYDYCVDKGYIEKGLNWHNLYQDMVHFRSGELSNEYLLRIRKKAHLLLYLNPKWFFRNFIYTLKNPDDLELAYRYVIKSIKEMLSDFTIVKHKKIPK